MLFLKKINVFPLFSIQLSTGTTVFPSYTSNIHLEIRNNHKIDEIKNNLKHTVPALNTAHKLLIECGKLENKGIYKKYNVT